MENRKIVLPENVKKIIETLRHMVMRLMRSEDDVRDPYWDEFLKIGIYNFCDASGNKNIV